MPKKNKSLPEEPPAGPETGSSDQADDALTSEERLASMRQLLEEEETKSPRVIRWGRNKNYTDAQENRSGKVEEGGKEERIEVPRIKPVEQEAEEAAPEVYPPEQVEPDPVAVFLRGLDGAAPEEHRVPEIVPPIRHSAFTEITEKKELHKNDAYGSEDIRAVALQGYEDVELAKEEPQLALGERIKKLFNSMTVLEKRVLIGVVAVVAFVILGVYIFTLIRSRLNPSAGTAAQANLPIPIMVTLPGGWTFSLNKGVVQDGVWNPASPEWLDGTVVCRWVALPWSVQLESVVRTLKPGDQIELVTSDSKSVIYKVQSVQSIAAGDLRTLDQSAPSLLLILVNSKSDTRWVVMAVP